MHTGLKPKRIYLPSTKGPDTSEIPPLGRGRGTAVGVDRGDPAKMSSAMIGAMYERG